MPLGVTPRLITHFHTRRGRDRAMSQLGRSRLDSHASRMSFACLDARHADCRFEAVLND